MFAVTLNESNSGKRIVSDTDAGKGFFVSDLHLFSTRSTGKELLPELKRKVATAHTFVLGGDIFDFKWSTHASTRATCDRAAEWIDDLMSGNPECEFHYILGNHDSHPALVSRLESFASTHDHFHWHRYFTRLDHCLFLHGDIADGSLDHARLDARREKFERERRKGRAWNAAYDMAVNAGLHRLAMLSIRELVVLQRVRDYADRIGHGPDSGVGDVYFGHTHIELDGVEHQGLRFHNGGAAIRGLPFRIVETSLQGPVDLKVSCRDGAGAAESGSDSAEPLNPGSVGER